MAKIEKVTDDDEVGRIIYEEILGDYCPNYYLVGEEKTCLGEDYLKIAEGIKNFEVRNDDIWVTTYPKAGTTWTQEMVWLICNNLDFKGAQTAIGVRFPFLEATSIMNAEKLNEILHFENYDRLKNSVEFVRKAKTPRFIKTHLTYSLLPDQIQNGTKTPKMIYVMRNPKDVCVSYLHHGNVFQAWRTNLENFSKVFMADKAMFGSYWKHLLGYWEKRKDLNMLVIKYEDMKADLPSVIRKVAKFLEKELTNEQIDRLTEHLSFESMKNNKAVNAEGFYDLLKKNNLAFEDGAFIRSGTVGKYKEEMSAETIKKFDAWIKQNIAGTSFEGQYDFNL